MFLHLNKFQCVFTRYLTTVRNALGGLYDWSKLRNLPQINHWVFSTLNCFSDKLE